MTKVGDYLVPFDANGNLMHYARIERFLGSGIDSVEWRQNNVFLASMEIEPEIKRGRSAKYVMLTDKESGVFYPMFVVDLVDAISRGTVSQGIFPATYWRVQKRGQNFGLRRAKADEVK